jgi:hypothetical protein
MAGDLNAKHAEWNSRLNKRGKILRDYAEENSCLIPAYPISCSALSSDHLPVIIDTACCSSLQYPPDRPVLRCTELANFLTYLEVQIPFDPELHNGLAIDTCVENFSGAVLKALAAFLPSVTRVATHDLR